MLKFLFVHSGFDSVRIPVRLKRANAVSISDFTMDEPELQYTCFVPGCRQVFKTEGGRKQHARAKHSNLLNTGPQFDLCK